MEIHTIEKQGNHRENQADVFSWTIDANFCNKIKESMPQFDKQ